MAHQIKDTNIIDNIMFKNKEYTLKYYPNATISTDYIGFYYIKIPFLFFLIKEYQIIVLLFQLHGNQHLIELKIIYQSR